MMQGTRAFQRITAGSTPPPMRVERRSRSSDGAVPQALWGIAIACAIAIALANLVLLIMSPNARDPWSRAVAFHTQYGVPALFSTVIAMLAGVLAIIFARRSRMHESPRTVAAWGVIGCACIVGGFVDLTHLHEYILGWETGVFLVIGIVAPVLLAALAVATAHIWRVPRARWPWLAACALLLTNPITELWKRGMTYDSTNYRFVAADVPWRFTESAWRELRAVQLLQESTEIAAAFLVVGALWTILQYRQRGHAVAMHASSNAVQIIRTDDLAIPRDLD